ncbi:MAG: EAL domain-containing response regulator [Gammaproteobacteria bacterium]
MTAGAPAVVVVEDHDFQRRLIVRMLETLGCTHVTETAHGREALAYLDGHQAIDLVVCDLDMPEMDGLALIRHIGEARLAVPVLITSGQPRALIDSAESMALACGVRLVGSLVKPVTPAVLAEALARVAEIPPPPVDIRTTRVNLDEMLHAIAGDEIEAWYQPKLALDGRRAVGAEALARWRHPQRGVLEPGLFVAMLEQSGHIDELTARMLALAARDCARWRSTGHDLTVAVNISLASLGNPAFADAVTRIVRENGLEPHCMSLEITETAAMAELAPALENLARLRMRGFGLSVDDYGTGFSNLRQLTRVPFTELKIAGNFVTDAAERPTHRAILKSSIEMTHSLGMTCVAEGVESAAVLELLDALACDQVQGYHIAAAMPPADFGSWLEAAARP